MLFPLYKDIASQVYESKLIHDLRLWRDLSSHICKSLATSQQAEAIAGQGRLSNNPWWFVYRSGFGNAL